MSKALIKSDSLTRYMAEVEQFPLLTREEELALAKRYYENNDREAAQQLVCANLRFVVKIAHEYSKYGFKVHDLIQEGNMGLMQAIKKFEPDRGYRVISYAVWWIRAYIQNYILKTWSLVKIGTTQAQRKLFYNLRKTQGKLAAMDGSVDQEKLIKTLNVKEKDIAEMELRMAGRDFSLDSAITEEGGATHMDMLSQEDQASQEDLILEQEHQEQVNEAAQDMLALLNDRERYIAEHRLMADKPMTLQEIGNHYGISRERARQIEEALKKKLRKALPDPQQQELLDASVIN